MKNFIPVDINTLPVESKFNSGYCHICDRNTTFIETHEWLRDFYLCLFCRSIPRHRALMRVLNEFFPNWRDLSIHESSPGSPLSEKLRLECTHYIPTYYYPNKKLGSYYKNFRCENLEELTFDDEIFDLTVTGDVFEHVMHPDRAFREIERTLKPGGAHVFTVPWYYWKKTLIRAKEENGVIIHIEDPDYHGNPISEDGSLVIREWGYELTDFIKNVSGLNTTVIKNIDRRLGLDGEFIEVFISRKG